MEGYVSKLTPLAATPPARRSIDLGPPAIKTMSQSGRSGQRGRWADPPTNFHKSGALLATVGYGARSPDDQPTTCFVRTNPRDDLIGRR